MEVLLCCLEWLSSGASPSLPGEGNGPLPSFEIVRSGSHRLAHDGAELIETEGNPLVYGELPVPQTKRTLLIQAHYDGQPVDSKGWSQPSPCRPVLRAGRPDGG
jgi:acetylornithine deacetylase/succinyl-diaminopimelate desuccinylase-like protein